MTEIAWSTLPPFEERPPKSPSSWAGSVPAKSSATQDSLITSGSRSFPY
jgi:hypothetical protein